MDGQIVKLANRIQKRHHENKCDKNPDPSGYTKFALVLFQLTIPFFSFGTKNTHAVHVLVVLGPPNIFVIILTLCMGKIHLRIVLHGFQE